MESSQSSSDSDSSSSWRDETDVVQTDPSPPLPPNAASSPPLSSNAVPSPAAIPIASEDDSLRRSVQASTFSRRDSRPNAIASRPHILPIPGKKPRRPIWLSKLASTTAASLKREKCCKNLRCFYHVNFNFFMECADRLLIAPSTIRRNVLKSYLDSDKQFRFDGRPVCVKFLKEGFHFSTVMIAEVASGTIKRHLVSQSSDSSRIPSAQSDNLTSTSLDSATLEYEVDSSLKKKEAIMSFVQRIAEDCGDAMPHRPDIHLPFHQIQEVFPIFDREYRLLYPNSTPVSKSYFRRVWIHNCPNVKVTKSSRFTICEVCDTLRTHLRNKVMKGESTTAIKAQRSAHLAFVAKERMVYQRKKDRARLHGTDYCSVIIDGADQSAFGLPHFTTTPKSQRGHALKVKLVGLLEHRLNNKLTLMTMTQEHQTGSNHVIECLHRFLVRKRREGALPQKLFVQLDNCSRENKNKYVMAYLELLVVNSVFDSVECSFLPVGHTHEDVDQAFSTTSSRLRVTNATTLSDLHSVLRTTYGGNVHVEHMKRVANFSGLCEETKCLRRIDKITQWRFFLFVSENAENSGTGKAMVRTGRANRVGTALTTKSGKPRSSTCYVKKHCDDSWQHLYPASSSNVRAGVLISCPDITKTPQLIINCPDGLGEVNKRLWSEDERINDADKLIELHDLRDFVFRKRVDDFHWDVKTAVELEFVRTIDSDSDNLRDSNDTEQGSSDGLQFDDDGDDEREDVHGNENKEYNPKGNLDNEVMTSASNEAIQPGMKKPTAEVPDSRFDYEIGSFVLVRCDSEDEILDKDFWVGKVVEVFKEGESNYASHIKVHWYDRDEKQNKPADASVAKYNPCYQGPKTKRQKQILGTKLTRRELQQPHYDKIHTDTVLVTFPGLTKNRTIPLSTQKKLSR